MYNENMKIISVKEAKNIREKIIGLIGKKKPYSLMLKTHFGIHTFGLKFAIDVLILSNNNDVVRIKKSLKPNNIFLWNPIHYKVLELPEGYIDNNRIKLNDQISLEFI